MEPDRVYTARVRADVNSTWMALVDPRIVRSYYFGTAPRSTWQPGALIDYVDERGVAQITGVLLQCEPPSVLSHTFLPLWSEEHDDQGVLTWTVAPDGDATLVTLTHSGGHGDETAKGSQTIVDALAELLGRA